MSKKYDESSIKRFAGLLGIRKKPTPYLGPPDSDGLWTCWREPADNTVDQALADRNKHTHLIYDTKPGRFWTVDQGVGIPVGKIQIEDERGRKEKLSALYVVTGLTHAGANFDSDTISRGTHGVGQKATNAMAKVFTVWTFREGNWWCIEFRDAKLHKEPYKTKAPSLPHGIKVKKGTVTLFEPDMSLFHKGSSMPEKRVRDWCQLTSYLVKGLEVKLTNSKGKTKTFLTKGPQEYLLNKIEEHGLTQSGKSFVFSSKEADIAIGFTDAEGDHLQAYTNGLHNKDGGKHVDALHRALFDSLNAFKETSSKKTTRVKKPAKKTRGKKERQTAPFTVKDLCDGLLGLVNYKIAAPQFNNQPKDKLTDDRVYDVAYPQFMEALAEFWKKHPGMARDVITRATLLRDKTASFLKDKKMVKNVASARKGLTTKLAGVQGRTPIEERELLLVEGDSAGGGAKQKRDKSFQAVYPLRGKPLNVMDAKQDKINSNNEVAGLLAALGVDMTGKRPASDIEYGRVVLMTDADVDGSHIDTLLIAILYRFTPDIIKQGRVYSVRSPLFKANHKGKVYFGMTKEELSKKVGGAKVDMTYLKGWGEINPSELGVAMRPDERTLIQITWEAAKDAANFAALMGKSPAYRKKLFGVE